MSIRKDLSLKNLKEQDDYWMVTSNRRRFANFYPTVAGGIGKKGKCKCANYSKLLWHPCICKHTLCNEVLS